MTAQTTNVQGKIPEWTLGDRMGKCLDHAGIGMQEMADYLGVSRTSVSNWVHGRITPSRQTVLLWSMRTGVDFDWIARGTSDTAWFSDHTAQRRSLRTILGLGKHKRTRLRTEVALHAHPHNHGPHRLRLVPDLPEQLTLPYEHRSAS